MTKKLSIISALSALAILMAGCAGAPTVKFDQANKSALKSVSINKEVPIPTDIYYHGRAQAIGMGLGGLLGSAIASAGTSDKEVIQQVLKKNNINVGDIVATSFASQLRDSGKFSLADGSSAEDAQFQFEVVMYGLGKGSGFSSTLYPTMGINGSLKTKDGKVLWQRYEYITPLNKENSIGAAPETFAQNPDLLRQALTKAASVITKMFVDDL